MCNERDVSIAIFTDSAGKSWRLLVDAMLCSITTEEFVERAVTDLNANLGCDVEVQAIITDRNTVKTAAVRCNTVPLIFCCMDDIAGVLGGLKTLAS